MINDYFVVQIRGNLPYEPTPEQENALRGLADFLLDSSHEGLCVMRGFAGTGKTSLVGALVQTLDQLAQKVVLLAPTGRAAKVFSLYARHPAYTIHKKIYRQRTFSNEPTNFTLNDNLHQHTLFIVDEASMIGSDGLSGNAFGSGCLLDDLVQYVYSGVGCRLLLMGDTAQLPPVGEEESPALSTDILGGYGLELTEIALQQVVRQAADSGILWNATLLRQCLEQDLCFQAPSLRLKGFADIRIVPGSELIDTLTACYDRDGLEDTLVVCRSNKRANLYNQGIRNTILYREDELNSGDRILIAKNNYYWTQGNKQVEFIANGDMATVRRVRRTRELYGFRFADVLLTFADYDDLELEATLLLDTLQADAPSLPRTEADRLFYTILEDYADVPTKRERMQRMKADRHYNALQAKYAYAVTCHKAQGGQWKNVFIDQGYLPADGYTPDYYRWLYTAFTRATGTLYLVNYPKEE